MAPASPISTPPTLLRQSVFVSPSDRFRGGLSREPARILEGAIGGALLFAAVRTPRTPRRTSLLQQANLIIQRRYLRRVVVLRARLRNLRLRGVQLRLA